MTRMFEWITKTWNPLCGRCLHDCTYCWAKNLTETHHIRKYQVATGIDDNQIRRRFRKGDYVFVQDMTDLFGSWVKTQYLLRIFQAISRSPQAKFLLLTKNPHRYIELLSPDVLIPQNCVLGCTLESDMVEPPLGKAPDRANRIYYLLHLRDLVNKLREKGLDYDLFLSIEPILDFHEPEFEHMIHRWIAPKDVAIGYDNYDNRLPEPKLIKTMKLITELEFNDGIPVTKKTLRKAWYEPKDPSIKTIGGA